MTADIIYVDGNDNAIGSGPIDHAVERGIIRRVVQVMLIDDNKGVMLLQKRALHTYAFPGRWNASTAGHVDVGETYEEAAYREMKEEIGVADVVLEEVGKIYIEEKEKGVIRKAFSMVYTGTSNEPLAPDSHEVSEMCWFSIADIAAWIERAPDDFTPSFIWGFTFFLRDQ